MKQKFCPGCRETKPVEEFYLKNKTDPTKFQDMCKLCCRARRRGYYYPKKLGGRHATTNVH
jgi:hypothetical protein